MLRVCARHAVRLPSASRCLSSAAQTQVEESAHGIFTPEHLAVQESITRFVEREINPHVNEWEAAGLFPARELFKQYGALGFLGLTKPESFGGQALDFTYSIAAAEALGSATHGSIPMAIGVQTDMATPALANYGSDEVRRQFLAPSISGEFVACLGVSEVGAGSDVSAISTSATRDGDEYVVSGHKMWTTNGTQAHWMCTLVNTAASDAGSGVHGNKTLLCIPMDAKGVRRPPIERGTFTSRVPPELKVLRSVRGRVR